MSTKRRPDVKIAVMGPTGTGKSSLIKLITGDERIKIGYGIESETSEIGLYNYFESDGRCVTFVDTPGFDDSREGITDTVILKQIATFLETQYKGGNSTLSGVLYLHRISDARMGGIGARNLRMFQKLCGSDSLLNVVIVTTRWDTVDQKEGKNREHELMTNANFFKPLIDKRARHLRHFGTAQSAHNIMSQVLANDPIVLQIQHELASGKKLEDTEAGSELTAEMNVLVKKHKQELECLRKEMEDAIKTKDDELKLELEREKAKLKKAMDRWDEDRRRMEGGLNSVRSGARSGMEAAENQLEEMRLAFLKANGTGSANGSFGDNIGTDVGRDSERTIQSQVIQYPSKDVPCSSRAQSDFDDRTRDLLRREGAEGVPSLTGTDEFSVQTIRSNGSQFSFDNEDLSWQKVQFDDNSEAHHKLEGLTRDLRQVSQQKEEKDRHLEVLSSQLCQAIIEKLKGDSQFRENTERLSRDVIITSDKQKNMVASFTSWKDLAVRKYSELRAAFEKERSTWSVEIQKLEGFISRLKSEVATEKNQRKADHEKYESDLVKQHRVHVDEQRLLKKECDNEVAKQNKSIIDLRAEFSVKLSNWEESRLNFERERKKLEFTIEQQNGAIKRMEASDSNYEGLIKKSREESERSVMELERSLRLDMERQKKYYMDLLETERKEKANLRSGLVEEQRIRNDLEAKFEREFHEIEVKFQIERCQFQVQVDEQNTRYEIAGEKQKKEVTSLRMEISNEDRRRRELEEKSGQEFAELKASFDGQIQKLLLEVEDQNTRYDNKVQKHKMEVSSLITDLSNEVRRRKDAEERCEQEISEFQVQFEHEHRRLQVEIEELKRGCHAAEERYEKEISGIRTELSNEVRRRKEVEEMAEQEHAEIRATFEKQLKALLDSMKEQKGLYDGLIEKQKDEFSRSQARLVEESCGHQVELEKMGGSWKKEREELEGKRLQLEDVLEKRKRFYDEREELFKNEHQEFCRVRLELDEEISQLNSQLSNEKKHLATMAEEKKELNGTIHKLYTSYQALSHKLEEAAHNMAREDFWSQRQLGARRELSLNAKSSAVVEFDDVLRQMLRIGLDRPDANTRADEAVIVIMGMTNSGKSSFIRQLTGDHPVNSEANAIMQHRYFEENGMRVTLIDTPDFDDSRDDVSDVSNLQTIATYLENQFKGRKEVNSVIYLHRVTDNSLGATHSRIIQMFKMFCGLHAFRNVAIITTRWEDIGDEAEGIMLEEQLINNQQFFKPFLDAGAKYSRHTGSFGSARRIVEDSIRNDPVELSIQRELADGKRFEDTSACCELGVDSELRDLIEKYEGEKNILEEEKRILVAEDDDKRRMEEEEERASLTELISTLAARARRMGTDLDSVSARHSTQRVRELKEQQRLVLSHLSSLKISMDDI